MKSTLFAILTTKKARKPHAITASLDKEFVAGAPWWSKLLDLQ